jgi:hypothetical protein
VSTMICPSELIRTPEMGRPVFSTAFTACVMWLGRNGHFPLDKAISDPETMVAALNSSVAFMP